MTFEGIKDTSIMTCGWHPEYFVLVERRCWLQCRGGGLCSNQQEVVRPVSSKIHLDGFVIRGYYSKIIFWISLQLIPIGLHILTVGTSTGNELKNFFFTSDMQPDYLYKSSKTVIKIEYTIYSIIFLISIPLGFRLC